MKKTLFAACIAATIITAAISLGRDPAWSGLAGVAVSPDGKTIVAGGQNRVIYVIDASTLEVRQRIWAGARVGQLHFNQDGTRLILEDDDENLTFYDTSTMEPVRTVAKAAEISCAPGADLLAGHKDGRNQSIVFLSMTDGNEKGSVPITDRICSFGLSPSGKRLAVLTEAVKSDSEPKVAPADVPKDLRGIEKKIFEQKNDGKVSSLLLFEVPSGKHLSKLDLWYTSGSGRTEIAVTDKFVAAVNYGNENARIYYDGKIEFFQAANSFNYGRGLSIDRNFLLTGGLRNGTLTDLNTLDMVEFQVDKLPGWPEYFEGFAFAPDGSAYAVTSGCRLISISKAGKVLKSVPVF